jgi:hypothetical protein
MLHGGLKTGSVSVALLGEEGTLLTYGCHKGRISIAVADGHTARHPPFLQSSLVVISNRPSGLKSTPQEAPNV